MSLKLNLPNHWESGESPQNQLLNSGEFLPEEKFENQETPGQIRRFGNPGFKLHFDIIWVEIIVNIDENTHRKKKLIHNFLWKASFVLMSFMQLDILYWEIVIQKMASCHFILDQIIDQCESESQARVLCKDIDTPKEGQRVPLCN
jgi:hypothetical protein